VQKETGSPFPGAIGWFGIRAIGSIYYLTYAIAHGLPDALAQRVAAIVVSILVHGISDTPLMVRYEALTRRGQPDRSQA